MTRSSSSLPSSSLSSSSSSPSPSLDPVICVSNVGRYPLSVILSFLKEIDGCCLLLTRRSWARHILPIFRLPTNEFPVVILMTAAAGGQGGQPQPPPPQSPIGTTKNRHTFVVVPVQDAKVRLERLNTRRWHQQQRQQRQQQRTKQKQKEKELPTTTTTTTTTTTRKTHQTTVQLAHDEWNRRINYYHQHHQNKDKNQNSPDFAQTFPSPHLLRFLQHPSSNNNSSNINIKKDPAWTIFQPGLTLIVSYPRSGNTLLRSYLERITGIVTGSDTRPDRSLSLALAETHGLVGEGICSAQQTIFCKTHWPERRGCVRYPGQRAILLIRNPWDAIDSYWNLNVTNTHTKKVTDSVYQAHDEFFYNLVRNEMKIWLAFHTFWIQQTTIPILLVRYEDLMENPQRELERILKFASRPNNDRTTKTTTTTSTSTSTTKNTTLDFWRKHIAAALQSGSSHGYRRTNKQKQSSSSETSTAPTTTTRTASTTTTATTTTTTTTTPSTTAASTTPKIGRSLRRYPAELLQELHGYDEQKDNLLLQLGYHVYQQGFPQDFYSKDSSLSSFHHHNLATAATATATASATAGISLPSVTASTTIPNSSSRVQSSSTKVTSSSSLEINQRIDLRPTNCPYGRLMRDWRRARTKDDTEPFPTVGE